MWPFRRPKADSTPATTESTPARREPATEPEPEPPSQLRARALAALAEYKRKQREAEEERKAAEETEIATKIVPAFKAKLFTDLGVEANPKCRYAVIDGIPLCLLGGTLPNSEQREYTLAVYKPCRVCGYPVGTVVLPPDVICPPLVGLAYVLQRLDRQDRVVPWQPTSHSEESHTESDHKGGK